MNAITHEELLEDACRQCGIGVLTVKSTQRDRDTAIKRAVVAKILRRHGGMMQHEIAAVMGKTTRAVQKMLVSSC